MPNVGVQFVWNVKREEYKKYRQLVFRENICFY
jgi:hypothetical protein